MKPEWWAVIVAAGAAFFAFLAFGATAYQGAKAREAVEEAKRAAREAESVVRLTERADVLMDGASLSTGNEWMPSSAVVLLFKNFGRTRANNVQIQFRAFIEQDPGTQGLAKGLPPIVLAAGDTQTIPFQGLGKMDLRFDGDLTYSDVFGNLHTTRCSGTFIHQTRTFRIDDQYAD